MKQQKTTDCKKCKKGLSKTQIGLIILSFYILISSIYGSYKLIGLLINSFN